MKPFDDHDDPSSKSVPDMIRILWSLYLDMSLDPSMAMSARHVRSAALALERTRRMAMQVCMEAEQKGSGAKRARKTRTTRTRQRNQKTSDKDRAALEWLLSVPAASPWKN